MTSPLAFVNSNVEKFVSVTAVFSNVLDNLKSIECWGSGVIVVVGPGIIIVLISSLSSQQLVNSKNALSIVNKMFFILF